MLNCSSIWLVDVNRQLPSVHLDGFDNSVDQFPSKEWLPENISLDRLDILKPIPEELKGKYDLVHVRLFLAVVQDDDPTPILRNLMDMLSQWTSILLTQHFMSVIKLTFGIFLNHRAWWIPPVGRI